MESATTLLTQIFLVLFLLVAILSETNVRNLSCDCSGKNSSEHCPKSAWSITGQNWFKLCQHEGNKFCAIKAAVILPNNSSYVASLPKVLPALTLAVEEAKRRGILPRGLRFSFTAYDDHCNAVHGQMNAIEAYANIKPHVVFGPSCEYSVASVARMVRFWNIPLLTTGAMTYDFTQNKTSCKDDFHLLVRTGVIDFKEISNFILLILKRYKWKRVALMYVRDAYLEIAGQHSCKLMMESLVNFLKKENISYNPIDLMKEERGEIRKLLESREMLSDYSDAFLGPVCDYVIAPTARYSATWGIPVLTAGAQANAFRHKSINFPTLTRMMGSYTLVGEALKLILENYGWKVVGLLYHNHGKEVPLGNSICHFTMGAVFAALNETPVHRSFNQDTYSYYQIKDLLQTVAKNSRIVVVCANPHTVREILLAAEELLMVDSGEYVFFNIELFNSMNNDSYTPWFNKNDTNERNERARKAYTALLTVTAMTPENKEYEQFSKEVKELSERNYNYSFGDDSVSTFITAFYDAVILYSLALNESIREGGSEVNGNDITRRMWNRTFKGITGDVHIDGNGDRFADYSLLDMDPETNRFEIVANYIGATKTLQTVEGKKIHWAANRDYPPPDTPKCGFDGSLCQSMPKYAILSIILSTLVFIVAVVALIVCRRYKQETEIAAMAWKISSDELKFINDKKWQGNMGRRGSQVTLGSYGGISTYEVKQVFIRRAVYKSNPVAVKEIHKTRFEPTRSLLCEFKRIRDIHHDHLVRFYGACITPSMIMFITEYCPRGSLQDILENEQFKLDWMFKFSLMQDIVRGMLYIHNSDIKSHGNLKSSNCLVDARFVLKISDFGLHSLRVPKDLDPGDHAYWKRLLWTAPELLRKEKPEPEGTPKGDVYSFGIIVHEMLTRQGPFYIDDYDMSPREIVENVKSTQKPSFRPIVDDLYKDDPNSKDVVALMKKCWGEEPSDRPDFSALKNHINKLNKENASGNILDNLLSRMEQYANNLEALVEERTSDYLEEKKKCEELLYQLLPKSVASQLIKGQSVIAETYDQVTIYFSDIVDFTSLSAESTPMQIVDMLNDLYTCFDSIIENFDVYKVETIGDAYMVVSGLPVRNGNLHAREIARMSLVLLGQVHNFRIRHRPTTQLKLRIGMHTGPCVAGVVGLKMPRYCLFGDTVNTASRMESNGEASKIHVSPKTKEVLDTFETFELAYRGKVELKGKGEMHTYWLLGEKKPPPEDCTTTTTTTTAADQQPKVQPEPILSSTAPLVSQIPSPTPNNKLANNVTNQMNNIESKNCDVIPNSSTPLLTNVSTDSLV